MRPTRSPTPQSSAPHAVAGEERLGGRQTGPSHQRQLLEVPAVLRARDVVGAAGEAHPVLLRERHAGPELETEAEHLARTAWE